MLILSRKETNFRGTEGADTICVRISPTEVLEFKVLEIQGHRARVGITAPKGLKIWRKEAGELPADQTGK